MNLPELYDRWNIPLGNFARYNVSCLGKLAETPPRAQAAVTALVLAGKNVVT